MAENRPFGREKNVTGGGKGIHRRGDGLNSGPVGSGTGFNHGSSGGNSGGQRSGGGGGFKLILMLLVLLLGGGGGLSSMLFGGGSSSDDTGSYTSQTSSGQYSSQSGSGSFSSQTGSGSLSGLSGSSSAGGLGSLSSMLSLFGTGSTESLSGSSYGWSSNANTSSLDTSVDASARSKFTQLKGNGQDTVTLMVYMCGTDLESRSGMATSDLNEMAAATLSDNVRVIVYTGGCKRWRNGVVSSDHNQVYQVQQGGIKLLVDNDGDREMTDPETLSRFIRFCTQQFPATRNQLILWDHGGGSSTGFGYDEKHSSAGAMSLTQIQQAVQDSGVKFDYIGFDACLMATAENALALSNSADYLIASEETEPGTGWYYTNWLSALSSNTSLPTTELGKKIVDDFIDVSAQKCPGQSTTLSMVDLAELQSTMPAKFADFSQEASSLMDNSSYRTVAQARSGVREFGASSRIDQIDLVDMANRLGTDSAKALAEVLERAVKYNRTSSNMTNAYGISIYFPQSRLSKVDSMVNTYKKLGIDTSYTRCIQQYAAVSASGQGLAGGSSTSSPFGSLSGSGYSTSSGSSSSYSASMGSDMMAQMIQSLLGGGLSSVSGLESGNSAFLSGSGMSARSIADNLQGNLFDPEQLVWTQNDGNSTLHLSEEQWALVGKLDFSMFFDDGEGYVDLGLDNTYSFTEGGDLIGNTDRTWISINSQPVAYYHLDTVVDGDQYTVTGRVPCLLNGERANLILVFDTEHPQGYIAGARTDYVDGETDTLAKAMTELKTGDTLDFVCDYYRYDGSYENSYMLGDQQTVGDQMLISNTDVGDGGALVAYRFTDLNGQSYWTPSISE